MHHGSPYPGLIGFSLAGIFLLVATTVLFDMFRDLATDLNLEDSQPAEQAATPPPAPSPPVDWNPLIITASVIIAAALLVAIAYLVIRITKRHAQARRRAQKTAAANLAAWATAFDRHDSVKDSYLDYTKNDLDLVLRYISLRDSNEPFMVRFLDAYDTANALRPDTPDDQTRPSANYLAAIDRLDRAWANAVAQAKRIGTSHTSPETRKLLKRARHHWAFVNDESASAHERAAHAKQMIKLLEGIIDLDGAPQARIEAITRLALETTR